MVNYTTDTHEKKLNVQKNKTKTHDKYYDLMPEVLTFFLSVLKTPLFSLDVKTPLISVISE